MDYIQSKDNQLIKDTKKLKEKKYRTRENKFLVEGFRFVEEALTSSFQVEYIFVSEKHKDRWESYHIEAILQKNTKVYLVSEQILKGLSATETPQGIVAVVQNKAVEVKHENGFYILADKVQDPGNMGTIIRTAHAAGALGVILTSGTVDVYNEKTLRSTMGSIFNIPVIEDRDLNIILTLKEEGFNLAVSALDAKSDIFHSDLCGKLILSVGNEGNGVSDEINNLSDIRIKIPMPGNAESLNVSVAAGIMMFESVRQRTEKA